LTFSAKQADCTDVPELAERVNLDWLENETNYG